MGRDIIARGMASGAIKVNINAGHIFIDNTARDAYFVTNPSELVENMYVYCNSKLQQYDGSIWIDRSAAIQGSKGDKGDNGITPHIDLITNNWFIDTIDTGIKAIGVDGVNGTNGINGADGVGVQTVIDNGDNTFTVTLTNGAFTIIDKIDTINSDVITQGTTNLFFTTTEKNKLTSIEENAEVNNISDTNATDLTDSGDTTLHYHSSDRNRTNHTGTQAISTVSGLQTALDNKINKDFTLYTQKTEVVNDDKIVINDSVDSNAVKYVTLNQLVSSVQDPHNKGYYASGTALNTALPTANDGDFAIVGATNTVWVWSTASSDFVDSGANGAVLSVNGRAGTITLTKADVGLNNVVNLDTSTTANITDSLDKRFVTDANLVVLGNTSGINTGDETQATITTKIGYTPENVSNKDTDVTLGSNSDIKYPTQKAVKTYADTKLTKVLADGYYEPKDLAIQTHITSTTNPHVTTKEQVGLGNVDNTSDLDKPVSTATQTALDTKASTTTLTTHTGNADIHVTAAEKTAWNQGIVGTPVGCIFPFAGINLPAGYLLCNGASYKVADYPALYAVIGNKYGGNTTNFNVPNLIDKFIQGSTTSGTAKAAGLPNITGETKYISEGCIWSGEPSGAFDKYTANTSIQIYNVALSGDTHYGYYFRFDASRANAIYGRSNTVQPPALTMVYIIKA